MTGGPFFRPLFSFRCATNQNLHQAQTQSEVAEELILLM